MACFGNYCLSLINSFLLILSLPFLLAGWIIKSFSDSPCNPIIYKPLFIVGVFLLFLSLIGMLGSCCRLTYFLWIYLTLVLLLIIILAFILIFGAANIKGGTRTYHPKEYSLQDFSSWLRNKMVDDGSWADIKACMKEHHACTKFEIVHHLVDMINFQRFKLSPIEVGCCKPPSYCGFLYMDEDTWKPPKNGFNSSDVDCTLWRNEKDDLCYDCNSCKASYLAQFMNYWRKLTIVSVVLLSFLTIVFLIGCCALL
ncbi:hypothetical protein V2J09_022396 [Rumex salicifolius]